MADSSPSIAYLDTLRTDGRGDGGADLQVGPLFEYPGTALAVLHRRSTQMTMDNPYRIAGNPDAGYEGQEPQWPRAAHPDPDDEITPPGEDDDLDLEEDDDEFEDGDDDDEDAEDAEEEPGETEPE
jgi:hypothetical protein